MTVRIQLRESELRCAQAALQHNARRWEGHWPAVTPPTTERRCRTGGLGWEPVLARLDETGGCRSLIQNNSVVHRTAWWA